MLGDKIVNGRSTFAEAGQADLTSRIQWRNELAKLIDSPMRSWAQLRADNVAIQRDDAFCNEAWKPPGLDRVQRQATLSRSVQENHDRI